jgi:HAD superfamily hydrolase (TIGR01490 family)
VNHAEREGLRSGTSTLVRPATSWTPAHFGHELAIFDLDRTLIDGSSLVELGRELVHRGIVRPGTVARQAMAQMAFRRHGLSDTRLERIVATLLHEVKGLDVGSVEEASKAAGVAVASRVHIGARFLIDHHLAAGDFCVVVSASPQVLVEAVTGALGMHRAVGSRLEVANGRYTGRFDGPFCYGPGKLIRLEEELGRFDLGAATAYADSGSDLPLLERCGSAVAINPDSRLRQAARKQSWPILQFR